MGPPGKEIGRALETGICMTNSFALAVAQALASLAHLGDVLVGGCLLSTTIIP